jgi:coenzyme F420 hydrogenase subunit beta
LSKKKNIKVIVENALCTGCGACSGICPTEAISMVANKAGYIIANVEDEKCIECGICLEVCPSNLENTPKDEIKDIFHGECLSGYIGYAKDKEIRKKSQSGGIVTALLCYLIENNLIDGAIVNNFNQKSQRPQAVLAKNRDEIIKSCGSYYSQSSVVKKILENKDKNIAAVVLGCQSESLYLIKKKYPKIRLPLFIIGLICAGQYSGNYIDDLIRISGCDKKKVTNFRFKDKEAGGWPGNVKICTTGNSYVLDKRIRLMLKQVYENYRCLLCFDQMNIFSDVAIGDPWGIAKKNNKEGNSVVISRTQKGKELIENAISSGVIDVDELSIKEIIKGQTVDSRLKTQFFTAMSISKKIGNMVPYNEDFFRNIIYEKPSIMKFKEISKRLYYSRKIYCEKDIKKIKRYMRIKKMELRLKNIIMFLINFLRRLLNYSIRKINKILNK